MATTSDGLIALLKRKGIEPTGDREADILLAFKVMPKPFKRVDNEPITSSTGDK